MTLEDMNNITLTENQQNAFDALCKFVCSDEGGVFILRGYAGTGKTTMMKLFVDWLHKSQMIFCLMAPTGRAAKVIKTKTGYPANTIHRSIYDYEHVNIKKTDNGEISSFKFVYAIKESKKVINIVDEASMVSSRKSEHELFRFGTDVLLDDLLEYSRVAVDGKLIFIGDDAQLPPIGDKCSNALSVDFFRSKNINVMEVILTEVLRQSQNSYILRNAIKIRDVIGKTVRNELIFDLKTGEVEQTTPQDTIKCSAEMFMNGESVKVICWSNKLAQKYNVDIRKEIFHSDVGLNIGDVLQIVKNNYRKDCDVFNGDFVRVLKVSPLVEVQSAPVWVVKGGVRVKENVSLHFRDVVLELDSNQIINTKIIEDLLYSEASGLSIEKMKALYINFRMRHPLIKEDSACDADAYMSDSYYNAIQAKYGYAITGHKSQGGEWDIVYVDYSGRGALNNDALRWMYTTTTRAKKLLRGIGMPEIDPLSHISFLNIEKVNSVSFCSPNTVSVDIGSTPFHTLDKPVFLKEKYFQVQTNAKKYGCEIVSVVSCQYLEKYVIRDFKGEFVKIDCYYKSNGVFSKYITDIADRTDIKALFENIPASDDSFGIVDYPYADRESIFYRLYDRVVSACKKIGASLIFVDNQSASYKLLIGFRTDDFSYIEFYYNSSRIFTKAIPRSKVGEDDIRLKALIAELYVFSRG